MNTLNRLFLLATALFVLAVSRGILQAQQPGQPAGQPAGGMNFDPQQMQQMMMTFFRSQLVVTNDEEWKVVETRLSKVVQVRMETLIGGGMNMFRSMRGNRGGDGGGGGGGMGRGMRGLAGFSQPSPEADALQKSIDDEAPSAELKARLEKFREAKKKKAAELAAAQRDLREVLSLRQEAILVSMGFLE